VDEFAAFGVDLDFAGEDDGFADRVGPLQPVAGVEVEDAEGGGAVGDFDRKRPFDVLGRQGRTAGDLRDEGDGFSGWCGGYGGGGGTIEHFGGEVEEEVYPARAAEGLQLGVLGGGEAGEFGVGV